jgi:hypothetical protein
LRKGLEFSARNHIVDLFGDEKEEDAVLADMAWRFRPVGTTHITIIPSIVTLYELYGMLGYSSRPTLPGKKFFRKKFFFQLPVDE